MIPVGTTALRLLETAATGPRPHRPLVRRDRHLHPPGLRLPHRRRADDQLPPAEVDAAHARLGADGGRAHPRDLRPRHRRSATASSPTATSRSCCPVAESPAIWSQPDERAGGGTRYWAPGGPAMLYVLKHSWALLLGMLLLLLGNGLQGTLLGIRGAIEGFDAATMSLVMSAYYVGFLLGSRRATPMIARVGHVRVFAALGSMISAAFILYAAAPRGLGLGRPALRRRLLLRRGLRRGRELAQRRRHQRDPRPGAVALHDRADGRHHLGAVHPEPRRPGGLHALRGDVGAGLALASRRSCSPPAPRRRSRPPSR